MVHRVRMNIIGSVAVVAALVIRRYDQRVSSYAGDSLSRHRDERNREIVQWFRSAVSKW